MYNGVCCGQVYQRTFSDIQQAIKEEIKNVKFGPFIILSEFWLSQKIIDFDVLIHTFWAQLTCMRASNSGKVSMEAEFYA